MTKNNNKENLDKSLKALHIPNPFLSNLEANNRFTLGLRKSSPNINCLRVTVIKETILTLLSTANLW